MCSIVVILSYPLPFLHRIIHCHNWSLLHSMMVSLDLSVLAMLGMTEGPESQKFPFHHQHQVEQGKLQFLMCWKQKQQNWPMLDILQLVCHHNPAIWGFCVSRQSINWVHHEGGIDKGLF